MTKLRGLKEAVDKLSKLGEEGERIASTEIVASALTIQTDAKRAVAVITGRLRNSIAVAASEAEVVAVSSTGTDKSPAPNAIRAGMLNAVIGTNVSYAKRQEFGFMGTEEVQAHNVAAHTRKDGTAVRAHGRSAHSRKANTPAKPYLKPAYEKERPKLLKRLRAELKKLESA
jgi:hypothetical protein